MATQAILVDVRSGAAPVSPAIFDALVQPASAQDEPGQPAERPILIRVDSTEAALQKAAKFWRSRFPNLRVVGITGSIGKTSTKELTAQVLSDRFNTLKSEGNLNNAIGVPLTLLRLTAEHEVTHMLELLREVERHALPA